jgi:hypothetical protein
MPVATPPLNPLALNPLALNPLALNPPAPSPPAPSPPAPSPPVRVGILRACRGRPIPNDGADTLRLWAGGGGIRGPTSKSLPFGPGSPRALICHPQGLTPGRGQGVARAWPGRGKSLQRANARLKPVHALCLRIARAAAPSLAAATGAAHGKAGVPRLARLHFSSGEAHTEEGP